MIYIVGLRLRDGDIGKEFTSEHVEAESVVDAVTFGEEYANNKYQLGPNRLVVCSVRESFLEVARRKT